jgi:hypothetical protein
VRHILEFNDYKDRKSETRTKPLSSEEFLDIIKSECRNFSFNNDMIWRGTNGKFGKFGLFMESDRKSFQ